jgi:hypothetical protein
MKLTNLYKVQAEGWRESVFSAAADQQAAIYNVTEDFPDVVPEKCSVIYAGEVLVNDANL